MAAYQKMKDSGIPGVGEIPSDWKIKRVKNLFVEINDRCENSADYELLSVSEYYGIAKRREKITTDGFISNAASLDGYKICKENDLVSNIMLAWKNSMGVSDYTGIVSPAYCVYRAKVPMHQKYFHYLFRTKTYGDLFKQYSTGIIDSRLRLYTDKFFAINCPVPSVGEQQAISDYLDEACSKIDSIIVEAKASIEDYKQWKASIIYEAVTKGLDPDVEMKDSGVEWIGEIPVSFESIKLKHIAKIVRGGSPRPIDDYLSDDNKGYNWIKIGDTQKGYKYIDSTHQKIIADGVSKSRVVHAGDLILTNSMSFGEPYILNIDGCVHDGWVAFQDYKGIEKEYLYYLLVSELCKIQFNKQVDGGVVKNLNVDKIGSTLVFVPPINEQRDIVTVLNQTCNRLETIITEKESLIADLESYKKSLIYEVVTGKRRVV